MDLLRHYRHVFEELPVWLWPWVWLQLYRINQSLRASGRRALFHFDRKGRLRVDFLTDAPVDPDLYTYTRGATALDRLTLPEPVAAPDCPPLAILPCVPLRPVLPILHPDPG